MHDDLGVGVALQVIVALGEELFLQLTIIGKLAVEGEGEPLGLAAVVALEGLGVVAVVAAAGGVADVADGHGPVHALHDRLELVAVVQAERLGDRPQLLVGPDQRVAILAIAGHPCGELPAVLHVQEHPRDQPSHAVDISGNRRQLGYGFDPEHERRPRRRTRGEVHPCFGVPLG